jgi:hypothetical protein
MKTPIYILFFLFSISVSSQTNWNELESDLWKQKDIGEITTSEWYLNLKKEAGSLTKNIKAWFQEKKPIEKTDSEKTTKLYFPENYQIEKENGDKYAKLYLENHSKDTIQVQKMSAMIKKVTEYFLIDNEWVKGRDSDAEFYTCGFQYDMKIEPGNRVYILIGNDPIINGTNKLKYKLSIDLNGQTIESNIIEVSLYDNQVKRLKETE